MTNSLNVFFAACGVILLFGCTSAISRVDDEVAPAPVVRNIDAGWRFMRTEIAGAQAPEYDDSSWHAVDLPYTWPVQEARGEARYYRGPAWYRTHLHLDRAVAGKSLFLRFGAASLVADVYVNGQLLGTHRGGFAAFCFDATKQLRPGDNVVAVHVNNAIDRNVPPLSGDFTVFGGLYRDVNLLVLNSVSISPTDDASSGVYLKTTVNDDVAEIDATTKLRNGSDRNVQAIINCLIKDAQGNQVASATVEQAIAPHSMSDAIAHLRIDHPYLWNGRSDPYLYFAVVTVRVGGKVVDWIDQPLGLRYFRVDANRGFFLNGKPYDLHGVNYHEGRVSVGFADTPAMEEEDNRTICDMGCTAVRMAHYQHNEYEYALCDKHGLVVWTELPLVNKMTDTPEFRANAAQQLRELIKQNFNHPSIFFWSMYNEPWVNPTAGAQEQWHLIADLVNLAHQLDPTRLTTGAAVSGAKGPINWYMDLTGMNRYTGWYTGDPYSWPNTIAGLRAGHPDARIAVTEYGAGASVIQHDARIVQPITNSQWHPEEWQGIVHEQAWQSMEAQKWLWAKFIWCMFDFSSSGRHEGSSLGINDKGLVAGDHVTRKDAFYYYKACWNPEPFVYITDRRFNPRPSLPADLKVYSNCDSVELALNGKSLGAQRSSQHVFSWHDVALPSGSVTAMATGTRDGHIYRDEVSWNVLSLPKQTN